MTAAVTPASKAVLIDLGGVLADDYLPAAAAAWGTRLGISQQAFLAALFGGSDDQVLTGRVSEPAWWDVVAARLHAGPGVVAELRQDLASREVWDQALVALLRRLRGHAKTAIVSNAWPSARVGMSRAGMLDITDEIVLSCEAGYAKPDPRIYHAALRQNSGQAPRDRNLSSRGNRRTWPGLCWRPRRLCSCWQEATRPASSCTPVAPLTCPY
jgi:putative hydrolase of the HAD superfamily